MLYDTKYNQFVDQQKRSTSTRVDQDAVSYISDLQESLSMESYKEFKKSLALYKQVNTHTLLLLCNQVVYFPHRMEISPN